MNPIWVLDIILAAGMIVIVMTVVIVGRRIVSFSKSFSGILEDVVHRTADLQTEAIKLMQSTEKTERHADHLLGQLVQLTSSADTAVRSLPRRGSQSCLRLPTVLGAATSIVSAYRFFRSVFLRRRS